MSQSAKVVQLTFSGDCVTAVYGSGQRQQVPQRCVERSQLLSDLSSSEHSGAETPAPCRKEGFRTWLDLVLGNRVLTAQEVISALKAADVLIDEEGVFEACNILADRYLAPEKGVPAAPFQQNGNTSQPGPADAETRSENAAKILEDLPQHLHLAVLRATLTVLDVEDVISLVPPSAAPVALRACCPSIDSASSLRLSYDLIRRHYSLWTAVDAAATLTHLQHLCIDLSRRGGWSRGLAATDDDQHSACIRHGHAINTIQSLTTLRCLELSHFHVHDSATADALAKSIKSATTLTRLHLTRCIVQHAELTYPFAECLLPLKSLQCLTLDSTCISFELEGGSPFEDSFEMNPLPLGDVVHELSSLTELSISAGSGPHYEPYCQELAALAHRGTFLSRIQVLRIQTVCNGDFGWAGEHNLHQVLSYMPSLQALHLAAINFESLEGVDFSANPDLRLLDLRDNELRGWDAQGTDCLGRLSALYLGGNDFSGQGVETLASHFSALTSLQRLSLGDEGAGTMYFQTEGNHLQDRGAAVLAQHLSALVCLTQLELRDCEIEDTGICDLASALRSVPCLRALNVENNPFGVVGLRGLAQGLPRCTTLRSLALGWCKGVRGDHDTDLGMRTGPGEALAELAGACGHLSELCIGGAHVEHA